MRINFCQVNWAYEDEELLEPYEWQEEDPIEWLFLIELYHVSSLLMNDCFESLVTFENLDKGYYIISDGHTCLAIAIDEQHRLCMRSHLNYPLFRKVIKLVRTLPEKTFVYNLENVNQEKEFGLTRFEREKKQLLLAYLDIFDHEEISELACDNLEYIEHGYHLFHEYLYFQICQHHQNESN